MKPPSVTWPGAALNSPAPGQIVIEELLFLSVLPYTIIIAFLESGNHALQRAIGVEIGFIKPLISDRRFHQRFCQITQVRCAQRTLRESPVERLLHAVPAFAKTGRFM
jgi:hypothetical protein